MEYCSSYIYLLKYVNLCLLYKWHNYSIAHVVPVLDISMYIYIRMYINLFLVIRKHETVDITIDIMVICGQIHMCKPTVI